MNEGQGRYDEMAGVAFLVSDVWIVAVAAESLDQLVVRPMRT